MSEPNTYNILDELKIAPDLKAEPREDENIMTAVTSTDAFIDLMPVAVAEPLTTSERDTSRLTEIPLDIVAKSLGVETSTGDRVTTEAKRAPKSAPKSARAKSHTTKPASAVVGGVEYVVGGWGKYEADLRQTRWAIGAESPGTAYGKRTYISGADAAENILTASQKGRTTPLRKSMKHLAEVLGKMEDALCESTEDGLWECLPTDALYDSSAKTLVTPGLTSEDINALLNEPGFEHDHKSLGDLADNITAMASTINLFPDAMPSLDRKCPALPTHLVKTKDSSEVLLLEAAVIPYVNHQEKFQCALATRIDMVAAALEKKLAQRT